MLVCKTNTNTSSTFKRQSKAITTRAPCPYGSIPKRRSKQELDLSQIHVLKTKKKKSKKAIVPYPLPTYASTPHSSLLSSFLSLFDEAKLPPSPVGFIPAVPEAPVSPFNVVAPAVVGSDNSYECRCDGNDVANMQDTCSCLTISTTSTISCGSTDTYPSSADEPPSLLSSAETWHNQDMLDVRSTTALSDLLCDHYVQTQMVADGEGEQMDVPLVTFRMFESPHDEEQFENKRWLLHNWLQPKKWIEVSVSVTLEDTTQPERHMTLSTNDPDTEKEHRSVSRHVREIRANPAHLRMLVAEINMMRADKIIGPLKPRAHLPKRLDRFTGQRSSKLRYA